MKRKLLAVLTLLLPSTAFKSTVMRMLGCRVESSARIGHSWLEVDSLRMSSGSKIGHCNYVKARFVALGDCAEIGHMNQVRGPIGLDLREKAAIGNGNVIKRAEHPVVWGRSVLSLGLLSKITASHLIDCTRPVKIGNYSILAGAGSQLWTHGYLHAPNGPGRFRIDGRIEIGDNVYIGSRCVINAGVRVSSGVTVGSNSCVSKSLHTAGLYVGQRLQYIELDYQQRLAAGRSPCVKKAVEKVLVKKPV